MIHFHNLLVRNFSLKSLSFMLTSNLYRLDNDCIDYQKIKLKKEKHL